MKILTMAAFIILAAIAQAQIPCPNSEKLSLPNDGPASAPQVCVNTALPATKSTVLVNDLVTLKSVMACGVTVQMKPGIYVLPASGLKFPSCTAGNWFIIKSSSSYLPGYGVRINPSYAGQASLAGRPPFGGGILARPSSAVFIVHGQPIVSGGYNRLGPGLEIESADAGGTGHTSLLLDARNISHFVFIRNLIHGTPKDEVAHGIIFSGSDHVAISGNYAYDFHCLAVTGACSDAQAFSGGNGASGAGYLIENNFIEASGEGVIFGGGAATSTASDVIIRRNHFFIPMSWKPGDPNFLGVKFIVKNNLEFKNCVRCLAENNLLENSWGGFSQNGYSFLITPKNQGGKAPTAQTSDIIYRFNHSIGGAGIQFGAAKDDPPLSPSSLGTQRVSIHDNLIEVDALKYAVLDAKGANLTAGVGIQLTDTDENATVGDVQIRNNTVLGVTQAAFIFGGLKAGALTIQNNIFTGGRYQNTTTGGAHEICSKGMNLKPALALAACWTNAVISGNYVIGGTANWPTGTQTPILAPLVSISGGDMHSTIPGLGADIDALTLGLTSVP